jgi:hypothetical protein
MDYENQALRMQIPGSVYFNILHMPENARHCFLVGVKQLMEDHQDQFKFWKDAWKSRDMGAELLKDVGQRLRFMKEKCTGNVDHHLWADRWQRIDKGEKNYLNALERAEDLDLSSQDIPDQKKVSIRHKMKKLGLLSGEPNFDESARMEFDRSIELSLSPY